MATVTGEYLGQSAQGCLISVAGVDLNVTTKSGLYTVPAGRLCVITAVITRNVSASLTTAVFGVGWNALANDVVSAALHTALIDNTVLFKDVPIVGAKIGNAGDIFGLKASLANGTPTTATIDVLGYIL